MLFWLACEDLKQEVNKGAIEEKTRSIYEDYVSILSPKEVRLGSFESDYTCELSASEEESTGQVSVHLIYSIEYHIGPKQLYKYHDCCISGSTELHVCVRCFCPWDGADCVFMF